MTEERLIIDMDWNIVDTETGRSLDDNQVFDLANEFAKENEQLKSENNRLIKQTAETIAEHQNKILTLIDEKIKYNEKKLSSARKHAIAGFDNISHKIDTLKISHTINTLKELKKELSE